METKAAAGRGDNLCRSLPFDHVFEVPRIGLGGLLIFWTSDVSVNILNSSINHVDYIITFNDNISTHVLCYYGSPYIIDKMNSWLLLERLFDNAPLLPWLILGDFNDYLSISDHSSCSNLPSYAMTHFQRFVSKFSLLPLNPIGSKFTWKHGTVCERLDWGVVNHTWQQTFPHTTLYHLGFYGSDHRVLRITLNDDSMPHFGQVPTTLNSFLLKQQACVDDIKNWNVGFNSLSRRIHALENSINAIHSNLPLSSDKVQRASALQSQLDSFLYKNEILWKQRSKIHWLQAGDKNTKYFHSKATDSNRDATQYLLSAIDKSLDIHQIQFLDSPFDAHEVKQALFQLSGDKAPGLDGLNPAFYQKNWHIIGHDLIAVILDTLNNKANFSSINDTLISVLGNLISPFQSAFLSERIIFDNIYIAQEVVHAINHQKHGKFGWVGLKLDMEKAFDRVEWDFLLAILNKFNFPTKFISLIHQCISSVTIRFNINGQISDSLHLSRGIRQGDPLSPYLFLLCSEGLTAALRLQEQRGSFRGISVARTVPSVSHLLFADDTLLFTIASPSSCNALKEALTIYNLATGQKVNYAKSSILFSPNTPPISMLIFSTL
ncbi:uncharacterized protein LOC133031999 [Cannabis sativa]|uniref:uncharacterized protein LOC133031999 n=1 Tax=Cannabis sativa TaxID=3483 RepID=UPI0029C9BC05|nr:uncharacterized protein LOC133031999 [Cannabis sativa]